MGNLSTASKEHLKQATRLRDHAYKQRRLLYSRALEGARAVIDQGPLGVAARASGNALEKALLERTAVETDLRMRIDELRRELEREQSKHLAVIGQLQAARKIAVTALRQAVVESDSMVDAEYSDVATCSSAASWKPYQDFLPAEA